MPVTVAETGEAAITLDANHPLAGQALTFELAARGHRLSQVDGRMRPEALGVDRAAVAVLERAAAAAIAPQRSVVDDGWTLRSDGVLGVVRRANAVLPRGPGATGCPRSSSAPRPGTARRGAHRDSCWRRTSRRSA